jgi:hypothetical protein
LNDAIKVSGLTTDEINELKKARDDAKEQQDIKCNTYNMLPK